MAKRRPHGNDEELPRKRPRVVHEAPTSEEVHSARQLMQLLTFDQDLQRARHGLQSFKLLLDKLNDPEKGSTNDAAILKNYLEAMRPRREAADGDDEAEADPIYLPEIMDMWDFAARMNNDNLMSAVPVVLALLIRYLSHLLDMAPICLGICRTLLRHRQLELIARNLSADRGKEFVISPTLRLLREALAFDGGAIAKPLFRARNFTYRSLARNMSIKFHGDGIEDAKRTSTRTNAVRFFLSSLKFLHPEAKAELLSQRETVAALTRTIKDDPPYVVLDILNSLRDCVLKDKSLPRSAKTRMFNAGTLIRIAGLYYYAHEGAASAADIDNTTKLDSGKPLISDATHDLLLLVTTAQNIGVLREQNGFYPQGVEPNTGSGSPADATDDAVQVNAGLDRIVWIDKFVDEVPVFNLALAELLSHLRPWSSTRQGELLIAIFKKAPELVSWYFIDRKNFTFDPKMSATWVGYAAFLFNTIQVDIPAYFGNQPNYARVPPPTSVIVDNILPRPLTQKILSRCLMHKSKLIPFFAMRLLAISMEKLRTTLQMHHKAARRYPWETLWKESERRVLDEFCRRCPLMKEIINAYRGIGEDDILYREAASRVLRLYYEVVPHVALNSKFDVSSYLFSAIRRVDNHKGPPQDKAIKLIELENLLTIAGYSPGMQWFSKTKGLAASPFAALLKVCVEATEDFALNKTWDVLDFVGCEQQLFLSDPEHEGKTSIGLAALVDSLKVYTGANKQSVLSDPVWTFLDNCIVRCASGPIKYIEMMYEIMEKLPGASRPPSGTPLLDTITMAIAEQLRFVTVNTTTDNLDKICRFLGEYLHLCRGNEAGIEPVLDMILSVFPSGFNPPSRLPEALAARSANAANGKSGSKPGKSHHIGLPETTGAHAVNGASLAEKHTIEDILGVAPLRAFDSAALSKWANKAADELVEDGYAVMVISLLVSDSENMRRQALVNLSNMAARIRESTYEEKDQVWLLLSELIESTKIWMTDKETAGLPVPSQIVSFACHALDVLRNPLHCLYPKVNMFLMAGPTWHMRAFPLVNDIVYSGPTEDETYYTEISWLLSYLMDSLRTPADVEYFRSRRLFETIVSVASNPYMRLPLRRQIFRLLYRVCEIKGGSTTLITRSGIVSWLAVWGATEDDGSAKKKGEGDGLDEWDGTAVVKALLRKMWDTCDQDRVENWSMHSVRMIIGISS